MLRHEIYRRYVLHFDGRFTLSAYSGKDTSATGERKYRLNVHFLGRGRKGNYRCFISVYEYESIRTWKATSLSVAATSGHLFGKRYKIGLKRRENGDRLKDYVARYTVTSHTVGSKTEQNSGDSSPCKLGFKNRFKVFPACHKRDKNMWIPYKFRHLIATEISITPRIETDFTTKTFAYRKRTRNTPRQRY